MSKKNMMILVAAVIVVIVIIVIVMPKSSENNVKNEPEGEFVEQLDNGVTVNTSEKLNSNKTYAGLEFSNIKFTNDGTITTLYAEIKNTTSTDTQRQYVDIKVLDESGNELTTFKGCIDAVKAGKTTTFSAGITANYANAYDIEITAPSN